MKYLHTNYILNKYILQNIIININKIIKNYNIFKIKNY